MGQEASFQVQVCGQCKASTKRVVAVAGPSGTTLVGRCMVCDTLPCPKCSGRTIDPKAQVCSQPGCKGSLNLMKRKG